MRKTTIFVLLWIICGLAMTMTSCKDIPGCTDPLSLTYSPDATSDDGTCSYERDSFLGTYTGTSVCTFSGFWNSDNFQFTIREDPDDPTVVRVAFPFNMSSKPVTFIAEVDGNQLIFEKPTNEPDNQDLCGTADPIIVVTGTASLNGTQFTFSDFSFHVLDINQQQLCSLTCVIEAEKDS